MRKPPDLPPPPAHLSAETAAWWSQIVGDYVLESHHLRQLQAACEAWDRCQQAREVLGREGLTFDDRFGCPHPRPEIAVERDARVAFLRALRELGLDIAPPEERARGLAIAPNSYRRRAGGR